MRCSKCGKELSEEGFSINPKTGKYYKQCNSCREYIEQNKEKWKEYWKEYSEQNRDRIKERKKKYYEQNKDRINEKSKEYREQNKDKIKEYREKNIQ